MGLCHVCMACEADSDEHIGGQAAGNTGAWRAMDEYINPKGEMKARSKPLQNGFTRRTLCEACNNGVCSRDVPAFARLVENVRAHDVKKLRKQLILRVDEPEPRRVVRHIITTMLALQPKEPHDVWKPLRDFVLDETAEYPAFLNATDEFPDVRPPTPRIFLYVNTSTTARTVPVCGVQFRHTRNDFVVAEWTFPPLGVIVCFAGGEHLLREKFPDISQWGRFPLGETLHTEVILPRRHVATQRPLVFGNAENAQRAFDNCALFRLPVADEHRFGIATVGAIFEPKAR